MSESELHIMALVIQRDEQFRGGTVRTLNQIKADLRAEEAAKVVADVR